MPLIHSFPKFRGHNASPLAKPLEDFKQEYAKSPHAGMVAAYATGDYTMQQVAAVFGMHYAAVSRAIKR